jgi:hypothetical protein
MTRPAPALEVPLDFFFKVEMLGTCPLFLYWSQIL